MPKRILRNPDEFSTHDLARYLQTSRSNIMAWLRKGRIAEPARDATGRRLWTRSQAEALKSWIITD